MVEKSEAEAIETIFPLKSSLDIAGCSVRVTTEAHLLDAARLFHEKGFVVVRSALSSLAVDELQEACQELYKAVRLRDPEALGNRNPGRYSFGAISPSGHTLHLGAFLHLVDSPVVHAILEQIYAGEGYIVRGVGGDFCTGSTRDFQKLHSDMRPAQPLKGKGFGKFADAPIHDKQNPPLVSVNYAVQDLTPWNGPMRILPWEVMESRSRGPPDLDWEPKQWLKSKLFPLAAGDAIIRRSGQEAKNQEAFFYGLSCS